MKKSSNITLSLAARILTLHFSFFIFHWPLQGQTTVQFYLVQFTGATNDTTINLQAKNNPVIYNGNYYWWPQSGTNLATTNGFAQINLIPGQYNLGIAGCPQTWSITVTNSALPLNAAGLTTSTLIYSGINTLTGNVVANDGHGNYYLSADPSGAALAATNGLAISSGLSAFVPTNSLLAGATNAAQSAAMAVLSLAITNNGPALLASVTLADGTISNFYQTTCLIPPQLLGTLQAYWTNNPNTSYFNPLATNTDAQAQLGNWNLPSVTITNAVALVPTNNGAVYYEVTNAAGWTPLIYQTYKAITFFLNGGTLYSKASGSSGQVKFNLGPCCFWDGYLSNIIFNAVNGSAIIENYCFHDNRGTIDVFNNTGANIEVNHCVIFSGYDTFHIFSTARIRHSLVYSASSGAAGNTCIRPGNVSAGFYAEDSVFCAQGSANYNIAVAAETAGTVGVLKGCTFYAGTNLNAACNTIMAGGTNTVIFLPQSLGIPTNQIYTDGLGTVTTSETASLSVSPYLLGVVVTNNPITTTSISANCFLTNGVTGQAGIMETNFTKGYMKLAQLPNIASINAEINISDVVGPGDQVEFLNAGTGVSTNVSLTSTATLICP